LTNDNTSDTSLVSEQSHMQTNTSQAFAVMCSNTGRNIRTFFVWIKQLETVSEGQHNAEHFSD